MKVTKRNGWQEPVSFDKILKRLSYLAKELNVDSTAVAQKTIAGVRDGITTTELDDLAAQTAAGLVGTHPDYGIFASRIAVSNVHKNVPESFIEVVKSLRAYQTPDGQSAPLVSEELVDVAEKYQRVIDAHTDHERDYNYDYFGFRTLERSYLLKIDDKVAERPQHMLWRVSIGIHGNDIDAALQTYTGMSTGTFTHASPTLFNAGTPRPSLSSCYLTTIQDSIEDIYKTVSECAMISKSAGGIGIAAHDVRAAGSYIRGTNGKSNGLIPMIKVFDATGRYIDQGGGKRKGAIAVYLEPWHPDVFQFLELRKNRGAEELRARDIFLGMWLPDLFMRRVEAGDEWSLFCPNTAKGLADAYGSGFDELYESYEASGKAIKTVKARDLWAAILDAQIETGTPYMLYKDAANKYSNQKNLGTIRSSNLCTEIIEYTSADETAVCNLASIAVNRFVKWTDPINTSKMVGSLRASERFFDFNALQETVALVTRNLDVVIDKTYYPSENAKRSNMRHRPIGIGVQGLADAFCLLGMPFDSETAAQLNREIFEAIYYAALDESCTLAREKGTYESFTGSPVSLGVLHHDQYGAIASESLGLDWEGLRLRISQFGIRNSLLLAPMPTASTSQILGNNECFEPFTSNIYVRRVLSGEFIVTNKHLLADLTDLGLWTPTMKNALIAADGSVQLLNIPDGLKAVYKTAWEIKMKTVVDMAADRQAFIDQSQSLNVFIAEPTHAKLSSYHFYAWKKNLKTGSYYIRTKPAASPIKFTVDATMLEESAPACSRDNPDCIACSS